MPDIIEPLPYDKKNPFYVALTKRGFDATNLWVRSPHSFQKEVTLYSSEKDGVYFIDYQPNFLKFDIFWKDDLSNLRNFGKSPNDAHSLQRIWWAYLIYRLGSIKIAVLHEVSLEVELPHVLWKRTAKTQLKTIRQELTLVESSVEFLAGQGNSTAKAVISALESGRMLPHNREGAYELLTLIDDVGIVDRLKAIKGQRDSDKIGLKTLIRWLDRPRKLKKDIKPEGKLSSP